MGKIKAENFPSEFDYIALGHIHKQQIIDKNPFIRYSGSPIPLSFSEKNDQKVVLLLETTKGEIHAEIGGREPHNIPIFQQSQQVGFLPLLIDA